MPSAADGWETVASKSKSRKQGSDDTSIDREYLSEYISSKCDEQCSASDFDAVVRGMLTGTPTSPVSLFQAVQVVHKFNSCVDEHVHHRRNYLIGIVKKTKSLWESDPENVKLLESRPRNHPETVRLLFELCKSDEISPDILSPAVCLALLSLTPEQLHAVVERYRIAPAEFTDSFHRRQQCLIELAEHLLDFKEPLESSPTGSQYAAQRNSWAEQLRGTGAPEEHHPGSDSRGEDQVDSNGSMRRNSRNPDKQSGDNAADSEQYYSPEEEQKASQELPSMLMAFINAKCAQNENVKKTDFDGTAREALRRMSFIQALQAIEHFAGSVSARINKRPAYLMGILRGQDTHWDKSRAAAQCPGGSAELLNLSPSVLMTIARLCLSSNCIPSDFTPEVCLALKGLPPVLAVKAIMAFNSNKRIVAGLKGGVGNRPRFFQRLIENVADQYEKGIDHSSNTTAPATKSSAPTQSKTKQPKTSKQARPHDFEPAPETTNEGHAPPRAAGTHTPHGTVIPSHVEDELRSSSSRRGSIGSAISGTTESSINFTNLSANRVWSEAHQSSWGQEAVEPRPPRPSVPVVSTGLPSWTARENSRSSLGSAGSQVPPASGADAFGSSSSLFANFRELGLDNLDDQRASLDSGTPGASPAGQRPPLWDQSGMEGALGWGKEPEFFPELKANAKPFSPPVFGNENTPANGPVGHHLSSMGSALRQSHDGSLRNLEEESDVNSQLMASKKQVEELSNQVAQLKNNEALLLRELATLRDQWSTAMGELNLVRQAAAAQLGRFDTLFQSWGAVNGGSHKLQSQRHPQQELMNPEQR